MKLSHALLYALALVSASAMSDSRIQMYVEEGDGIIALTFHCSPHDDDNECNCAIAGPGVVPSVDDALMCWNVEDKKIIFTRGRFRFEKRLDEIKTRTIDLPDSGAPLLYVPEPLDPDRYS